MAGQGATGRRVSALLALTCLAVNTLAVRMSSAGGETERLGELSRVPGAEWRHRLGALEPNAVDHPLWIVCGIGTSLRELPLGAL